MLKIEEKTFMNLQEAVAWLLDNNSIPFQCTANYAANTEIGLGTIVNPSPAKVRIGSLIFFADSKVSTVIGITETGFICSDKYNNLVDDIAYVTDVAINSSAHLITTLSDGQTIDAGLIKQVSSFSIDASQHLIANFNNGTTNDLGAIFNGNVNISGNFTANSIIENMNGYSFEINSQAINKGFSAVYASIVKNGNKLTAVFFGNFTLNASTDASPTLCYFRMPTSVANKLIPYSGSVLMYKRIDFYKNLVGTPIPTNCVIAKTTENDGFYIYFRNLTTSITDNDSYNFRIEVTFLLSENMAS